MQQKHYSRIVSISILLIAVLSLTNCHSSKPMGKDPGKNKPAVKDSSSTKKIDDGPSEFFQ